MARTSVPISNLVGNGSLADPAGTTLDATNDHSISIVSVHAEELLIRVTNTHSSAHTVTVKAGGTNPPAWRGGQGDLTVSVPATTGVAWIGPLSSSRFQQAGSTLYVDIETSHAGTITAFKVPRGF
ncbi:hypothetical protein ACFYPZ_24575 [Streptomyces sp. NPDC005506]|uniref:hypothetical protein n=1 Tax=Streptomyces sp. NPDC005506 TaxID=3364718 RepID=UPI0036CCE5C4